MVGRVPRLAGGDFVMKELIERLRDEMLDLPPEPNLPEGDYLEKDWYITKYAVNYSMFWRTQAADAIERLTAERDALRADAEMYRWIEKNTDCSFGLATFQLDVPHPSYSLSYCIDAAIAGEKT